MYIVVCDEYESAIDTLGALHIKTKKTTIEQKEGESMDDKYVQQLQLRNKDYDFKAANVSQNRDDY